MSLCYFSSAESCWLCCGVLVKEKSFGFAGGSHDIFPQLQHSVWDFGSPFEKLCFCAAPELKGYDHGKGGSP